MKKCLALAVLFSCVGSLHANNQWQSQAYLGFSNYIIKNPQGQKLSIACNRNAGKQYDHAVSFTMNHLEYHNTVRQSPLSFVIDQRIHLVPPATTTSPNDVQQWNQFKNAVAKASSIEVWLNNTRVGYFSPSSQSTSTIANEIHGCEALG